MKILKLSNIALRHNAIILISIAGLIAIVSISLILLPAQEKLRSTQSAIQDIQKAQNISGSSGRNLVQAKQRGSEISETEATFNAAFVPKKNPLYLIALIEELAESRNIAAEISINDSTDTSETAFQTPVTIGIEMTGQMKALLEFLNDLSTSPILLDVKNITVTRSDEIGNINSTDPLVSFNVQIITYWK